MKKNIRALQLAKARHSNRLRRANDPRKKKKPIITKAEFLAALKGSGGVISVVIEKLKIHRATLKSILAREDWADMVEELKNEVEDGVDIAENTILDAMKQRLDMNLAANTAKWYLSKRRKETFGEEQTKADAGAKTIHDHRTQTVNIGVDALNLPVEMKRKLLQELDRYEDKRNKESPKQLPGQDDGTEEFQESNRA